MKNAIRPRRFNHPPSLWPAVAALAGVSWPLASPEECARFLDRADRNRLLTIAAHDLSLPDEVRNAAAARHRPRAEKEYARAAEQEAVAATILATLDSGSWLALKGADYARRLYADARLRPMNDVDILLRRGDREVAIVRLEREGFVARPRSLAGLEVVMEVPRSDLIVDVYDCFTQATRADIDEEAVFAEAARGDDGLFRMAQHHGAATHMLLIANLQFVTHLRKYLDLWLFLQDPAEAERAIDDARRWNIRRAVWSTLRLMTRVFPEAADASWQADARTLVSASDATTLERWVLPDRATATLPSRPTQIWRKLMLIDTAGHRRRFLAATCRQRLFRRA